MEEIKNEYFFIDPDDGHNIDLCEKNRPLVLSHVKKIEKSLRKNSSLFLTPIMVGYRNGIVEIIDGRLSVIFTKRELSMTSEAIESELEFKYFLLM